MCGISHLVVPGMDSACPGYQRINRALLNALLISIPGGAMRFMRGVRSLYGPMVIGAVVVATIPAVSSAQV